MSYLKNPLNLNQANDIFDVLMTHAGYRDDSRGRNRAEFVYHQTSHVTDEFRFMGSLGFGGKFWRNYDGWRVTCYREDETPELLAMIEETNAALKELWDDAQGE